MQESLWHSSVRMSGSALLLRLPDAEWRMRHGFPVELVEKSRGSLDSLAEWLEAEGFRPMRRPAGLVGRVPSGAAVRLVEVAADAPVAALTELTRRAPAEPVAIAAVAAENEEVALSKALAIGPDDLLTYPFEEDELRARLDALHQLGRARTVLAERGRTFARFAPPPSLAGPPPGRRARRQTATAERPRVLVIGPASQHKVKVGEALARAAINYADNLEKARGPLDGGGFDLVVLLGTNPAARRDLLRWPERSSDAPPATLLVLDRGSESDAIDIRKRLAHLPVADRLYLPQPAEVVRARMDFWLALVRLQRQLLSPPADGLYGLCHDALTGLFNHGYFLEHLRDPELEPPHRRALVLIELINLPRLNESAGHAAVNRYLAALGPTLRRHIRAEDLPAHLGSGRFAVLLDDVAPGAATRIGRRLEHVLSRVPHGAQLTPRLTARSIELPPGSRPLDVLHETLRWPTRREAPAAA